MPTIVPDDAMLQHEIEKLAVRAGRMILAADTSGSGVRESTSGITVSHKSGRRDLVTSTDLEIQRMLMKRLTIFADDCAFLCEEDLGTSAQETAAQGTTAAATAAQEAPAVPPLPRGVRIITDAAQVHRGTCFIIDPIDGTANFVHGQRHSCTSIAMTVNGQTRLGVIYDPYRGELFSACKGRGAWLNGKRLPSFDAGLSDVITVFGTAPYDDTTNASTFRLAHLLYELSADVRRTGSAALDLCWTACGRFGLYAELSLSPWDFAAGKLIAEEAGCVVTDIDGQTLGFDGKPSILCGRKTAAAEFLKAREEESW